MKKVYMFSILLAAALTGFTSCGGGQKEKATTLAAGGEKPKVKIMAVTNRDVDQSAEFTATVEPEVKNNIVPQSPGRIKAVFVEVGARVSTGQRLAQMDAVNLSNTQAQLDNIRATYNRMLELYGIGGTSKQDLDNAKLQMDMAEINLKNLAENTYLISPINGIVTARNYDNGDMYTGQVPILTVMQINPVKLKINVSESYYSKISVGMTVDVNFDVFGSEVFQGKVKLIYPTIDDVTRTFTVEVALNNRDNRVRPGMFGRVTVNFGVENRVVVPDQAIVKQPGSGEHFVYLYNENGTVTYQRIELGKRFDTEYEILSGIDPNRKIVVAGQARLADGLEVQLTD
jgi:RND family efflux transporter MFP subunit